MYPAAESSDPARTGRAGYRGTVPRGWAAATCRRVLPERRKVCSDYFWTRMPLVAIVTKMVERSLMVIVVVGRNQVDGELHMPRIA